MALSFDWNSGYESRPTGASLRSIIDNEIRQLRRGIREVMEQEHNWGPYTDKDDGSHRRGYVRVLLKGDSTDDVSNPQEGSLYLLDPGGTSYLELFIYYDGSWHKIHTGDHGELDGLGDDDHSQYAKKSAGTVVDGIDMDGNKILIPSASGETAKGFTMGAHYAAGHMTVRGLVDAMASEIVPVSMINILQQDEDVTNPTYVYAVSGQYGYYAHISIPDYSFFPNFYAYNNASHVSIIPPVSRSVSNSIALVSAGDFDATVKLRYIGS